MSSSPVHRIRLQGPWEVLFSGADDWQDISVPGSWNELCGDASSAAMFRRRFNTPTGLEPDNRIRIRIPAAAGEVSAFTLNETALSPVAGESHLFDVTDHLQRFNVLQFQLEPPRSAAQPGGLPEPVVLEIHAAAEC